MLGTTIRAMVMGLTLSVVTLGTIGAVQAQDPQADLEQGRKLVIMHTNDLHGNIEADSKGRGGITRLATLIRQVRQENPNCVIYLDAGDDAQGTPVSNIFYGEPTFKAIKSMDPLAGAIGNHEYDWGLEIHHKMLKNAGYPILAANVLDKSGKNVYQPYLIKEINGIKVGVIGLTSVDIPSLVKKGYTGDLQFIDPAQACVKFLPEMYAKGAELIVAVSHCGVEADKALAETVPAIDLIVGGHSHTKVEPAINVGDHTWIVQAGHYGRYLGRIDLQVNPYNGKIFNFESKLIPVDKDLQVELDPTVVSIANEYNEKIRPIMEQEVGVLKGDLKLEKTDTVLDSSLGTAICEAIRHQSKADMAFYNWGGIRIEAVSGGKVKLDTLFRLLPFDDPVVVVEMKGKDVIELLNQALAMTKVGPLQAAGVDMIADKNTKQVSSLKVQGKAIDPEATYRVATTEFLAKGGDSYTAFSKGQIVETAGITRDVFKDYLASFKDKGMPVPKVGNLTLK